MSDDDLKVRRVHVPMSAEEVERLDNWRAGRQIWSRSEAIRLLINEGLDRADAKAKKPPTVAAKPGRKAPRPKR